MINLIPNQEKKKMLRDFYYRLAILSVAMLSVSVLIATVALLPSYFLSLSKNNIASEKLETQKKQPTAVLSEETLTMIKGLNMKLNLVETSAKDNFLVSQNVIDAILLKKMEGIKISQISYERDAKGRKISINGTANSREVLLAFRQALERDTSFKSVLLPISNFVKGSDIQFYLSLIPS